MTALAFAAPAHASITGVSGQIDIVSAPADARIGQYESSMAARAWDERQRYTLTAPLTVDSPSTFHASTPVPAGTVVDSHMIHADIVGGPTEAFTGTVTFDTPILGVIVNDSDLVASDFLGAPTLYSPVGSARGTDVNSDTVTVSANATTISFHTQVFADEVRVITQASVTPPTAGEITGLTTAHEGDTQSYSVAASSPDPLSYAWKVAAGNASIVGSSTGSSAAVQFTDGPSNVQLQVDVSDSHGNTTTRTVSVDETNVAPTLSALALTGAGGTACQAGNQVGLSFSFTDPAGAIDVPYSGTINWGDGSPTSAFMGSPVSVSHPYGPGSFTITVNVSDKDGGIAQQQTAAVSLRYANSGVLPPVNADGSSVFKFGSTIPVKVRITDCAGNPVPGLSPEIGTSMSSSLTPAQGVNETPSTSAADSTGHMRYDSTAGQYIYNFATKYLSDANATYYLYVRDASIGQITQKFGVRSN